MTVKALYTTDNYTVVITDKALNETGDACDAPGYAVVNVGTGITEHTTLCLPAAMFQADNFNRTLTQLTEEESASKADDLLDAVVEEDVTSH
jgi:hypothetical protein